MENFQKAFANGESISLQANDGIGATIEALSVDTTLSAADSGKIFTLDAVGEVITLPAVADGLKYKFICSVTAVTSDWTIVAATNVIFGSAQVAGAVVAASAQNTITLVVAKFLPGDWVSLVSDGTNWYVEASVVTTVGITFTAP
jgi:hypothetical protein